MLHQADGDHDITEIRGHKFYKNDDHGWWLKVLFESISGDYENKVDEVPLTITYSDCQVPVDENIEDENLVMRYAKQISSNSKNSAFLQAIATIAGKPKGILFPENNLSKNKKPTNTTIIHDQCGVCQQNHDDYSNYKAEESDFYFKTTQAKWYGLKCRMCGILIGSNVGNFRPTPATPVYVCGKFALDKTTCAQMVCNACFDIQMKEQCAGTQRRRRGNGKK